MLSSSRMKVRCPECKRVRSNPNGEYLVCEHGRRLIHMPEITDCEANQGLHVADIPLTHYDCCIQPRTQRYANN